MQKAQEQNAFGDTILEKYSLQNTWMMLQAHKFIEFCLKNTDFGSGITSHPTSLRLRPIFGVGAIKAHGRGISRHNAAGLSLHLDASSRGVLRHLEIIVPIQRYPGVSKNFGTPKSSNLIGFSIINYPILGYPYFWKHPLRV